jgi:hypothetical protein
MIYALNLKSYTKYINYKMQNKIKIKEKKLKNQILKLLNYKHLLTQKKNLNLKKKSNKFCKQ